ncbi:tetratricopeptide repeat protein [Pseudohalioglobus lutimaris]|uniref:protein O-GlcNAc transferase n=1 Tax=Pseudohalioglobus lutimaris TaxID=1737061 RepID=A0A2N5X129_9GAMM|nr:tetratricopeptide repeat protein [Pseudohalioglobus lutimaris]PLW68186.1 hypothetical protein C0039_13425 [Pseudohalioglobus lutimaris]
MTLNVEKTLRKARGLAKAGDPQAAAQLYRAILERFPQNRKAISGLRALGTQNKQAQPASAQVPSSLMSNAVNLYRAGSLNEALAAGSQLASRFPTDPMIHNFVGVLHSALGQPEAAIASYRAALGLNPDYVEVRLNMGVAWQQLGMHEKARDQFAGVLKLQPTNATALSGLAGALRETGDYAQAIDCYLRAAGLQPDNAVIHNNLGNIYQIVGHFDEAAECFARSTRLAPENAEAHCNLGHAFNYLGRHKEAITSYRNALRLRPGFSDAQAKVLHLMSLACDWSAVESAEATTHELGMTGEAIGPFVMLVRDDNLQRQYQRALRYCQQSFAHIAELPPIARPSAKPARLKIGYFSADFHDHATMFLMAELFELHDSSRFDVHAFSFGPSGDDTMSHRLQEAVAHYHEVRHLGDKAIALLARSLEIDIAIDLKGYTQGSRPGIFAFRAAPVQISYLGYPGTMGMPAMDYLVADKTLIPAEKQQYYTERIIYLPNSYQVNDSTRAIAGESLSRSDVGLPEEGFVFCCFNSSYKITPREFDIWMRLLQAIEGSVLWLLDCGEQARQNLALEAQKRQVDAHRIVFAGKCPQEHHLARHRLADLFLDTFSCNAHTTASDALWAGLPVLTKPGEGMPARVAASLLYAAGLPELVTDTEVEYERLALELARDTAALARLRNRLVDTRLDSPLFDSARFTRHLESAYQQVYDGYFQQQEPGAIEVTQNRSSQ